MTKPEFKNTSYPLSTLLEEIDRGEIVLAPTSRLYVWDENQIEDLFSSIYRGYPVGQLVLWNASNAPGTRTISADTPEAIPRRVIVDGQQRLTSLYCMLKGTDLPDASNWFSKTRIAFRPRDRKFEAVDEDIKDDPEYIPDISVIWDSSSQQETTSEFLRRLAASSGELTENQAREFEQAIDQLFDLRTYTFNVLELGSEVSMAAVADVFVRVNKTGDSLDFDDEAVAMMSEGWDGCREQIESFADRAADWSADPTLLGSRCIKPVAEDVVRVITGFVFGRTNLGNVFGMLERAERRAGRGRYESRDQARAAIQAAKAQALSLENWHEFNRALRQAGVLQAVNFSDEYVFASYLILGLIYASSQYELIVRFG